MTPSAETKSVAEVLLAAADRLSKRGAWTQGAWARDRAGNDLNENEDFRRSPNAACWCISGAILEEADADVTLWRNACIVVTNITNPASLTVWNDASCRRKHEVVSALRQAAALAREEAK